MCLERVHVRKTGCQPGCDDNFTRNFHRARNEQKLAKLIALFLGWASCSGVEPFAPPLGPLSTNTHQQSIPFHSGTGKMSRRHETRSRQNRTSSRTKAEATAAKTSKIKMKSPVSASLPTEILSVANKIVFISCPWLVSNAVRSTTQGHPPSGGDGRSAQSTTASAEPPTLSSAT